LLQGLCVCSHCGHAMCRLTSRKTKNMYYRCIGTEAWRYTNGAICDNPTVIAQDLDEAVWNSVMELLKDPDLIQGEIRRRMEVAQDHGPVQRRQDELEKEYAGLESKTKRLID